MREIIEKYYRREHSALSEEDIEDQNCIHTPDEMIDFALNVVKKCSIPDVVGRSEQLKMLEHIRHIKGLPLDVQKTIDKMYLSHL